MAASVRIEDEAFADERYEDLAAFAGLADADHARGKMAKIWRQCTLEQTHKLENHLVIRVLGPNGVDALVRARLADRAGDSHVRVRGTKGRIEWLQRLRENGSKGGRPKGQNGKPSGFPIGNPSGSENQNPPAPAPAPTNKKGRAGRTPRQVHPDRARVIDAFHQAFKAAYGEKPTWGDKEVGQIATLLTKHSGDVLISRMQFMFAGKAKWPPGPYSLDVFVANIDRFVEGQQQISLQQPIRKEPEL